MHVDVLVEEYKCKVIILVMIYLTLILFVAKLAISYLPFKLIFPLRQHSSKWLCLGSTTRTLYVWEPPPLLAILGISTVFDIIQKRKWGEKEFSEVLSHSKFLLLCWPYNLLNISIYEYNCISMKENNENCNRPHLISDFFCLRVTLGCFLQCIYSAVTTLHFNLCSAGRIILLVTVSYWN